MEYWEFLIQKEGDRTWQPLKTPTVNLEAGRYRMVARCNYGNSQVEVRITHQTEENPPQRRVDKRSRNTNQDGLMVVIPYTHLEAGLWEIHCSGVLKSQTAAHPWENLVQLNISAVIDSQPVPPVSPVITPIAAKLATIPLTITLNQQNHTAQKGKPCNISGQIQLLKAPELATENTSPTIINKGQLRISLRNPQNSEILQEFQATADGQTLPIPFDCWISIPDECETRLILGEVGFYDETETKITSESFIITLDLDELLDAIPQNLTEEDFLYPTRENRKQKEINLNFLEFINSPPQNSQPLQFQISSAPPLPPILDPPAESKPKYKSPQLPKLGKLAPVSKNPVKPKADTVENAKAIAPKEKSNKADLNPAEMPIKAVSELNIDAIEELANAHLEAIDALGMQAEELITEDSITNITASNTEILAADNINTSPLEQAFQELNLQDRFLSRLNSLASDAELSQWLQTNFPTPEEMPGEIDPETGKLINKILPQPIDWEAREIVLFDDSELQSEKNKKVNKGDRVNLNQPPVATPVLIIPEGELTPGKSVIIRVKLPENLPERTGVKLWLQDRQTRSLLNEPTWLTNFSTNGRGEVEAIGEIAIPYSSVEIQFEAIAIEMSTQRQSYKVSLSRLVGPAAPISLPQEDFNY